MISNYLPIQPIKGQAFTLYVQQAIGNNGDGITAFTETGFDYINISKDAAQFVSASNSAVEITPEATTGFSIGAYTLDLTSSEMDADVVVVSFVSTNGSNKFSVIIHTAPDELSSAPDLNSTLAEKITAIFQYLFFKRTVTSSVETLKKSDGSTTLATADLDDNGTTFTKDAAV